jgi:diacylglycerol kinase family enzyme
VGLPVGDPAALLDIAATGTAHPVDLGYVNGRVMLNTSSVGAYPDFVRHRETVERWLGYHLASGVAAMRVWIRPRLVAVELTADDGTHQIFRTPLLFVGVHERTLGREGFGERKTGGERALHVVVVKERTLSRLGRLAFAAIRHGVERLKGDAIEAYLVSAAVANVRHRAPTIAVDGELVSVATPLRYELKRDAALIVRP